jgi:membrane protein
LHGGSGNIGVADVTMRNPRSAAAQVLLHPGGFTLAVLKQFMANQGFLLAGAVAYYALLSLVPLLILMLMLLSQLFPQERLLLVLREYLEFVVPGQSAALVDEVRLFLGHQGVVGTFLVITMVFFSSLAFTVLEKAMAVIFFHRFSMRRRHFLVSAIMPYLFILFLGTGLIVVTVVSGVLEFVGARNIVFLGHIRSLDTFSTLSLYLLGVAGEAILLSAVYLVMPAGRLSVRHALIGGTAATVLWEITRHILGWYYATVSQIQVVYGSLTTSVGILLSVEFGALVLLLGAQVIAEYERLGREREGTGSPSALDRPPTPIFRTLD